MLKTYYVELAYVLFLLLGCTCLVVKRSAHQHTLSLSLSLFLSLSLPSSFPLSLSLVPSLSLSSIYNSIYSVSTTTELVCVTTITQSGHPPSGSVLIRIPHLMSVVKAHQQELFRRCHTQTHTEAIPLSLCVILWAHTQPRSHCWATPLQGSDEASYRYKLPPPPPLTPFLATYSKLFWTDTICFWLWLKFD